MKNVLSCVYGKHLASICYKCFPVNTVSENQQEKMYEMTGSQLPQRKTSPCTYPARVCWLHSSLSRHQGILQGCSGADEGQPSHVEVLKVKPIRVSWVLMPLAGGLLPGGELRAFWVLVLIPSPLFQLETDPQ